MNQPAQPSTLVNWLGYLALTLLLVIPLSVLTVRSGAWQQGLLLLALACAGSALLLVLLLLLLLLPRHAARRRALGWRALATLPGTLLVVLLLIGSGDHPPIHDVSTDTANPPHFVTAAEVRGEFANSLELNPDSINAQLAAYPDLKTLRTPLSIENAFARSLATAAALGWEVYHQDLNSGLIEAVATTSIMGFKDDVVIRLRTDADGTLVDLRSVSRVGLGDMGANADRIRSFLAAFEGAPG